MSVVVTIHRVENMAGTLNQKSYDIKEMVVRVTAVSHLTSPQQLFTSKKPSGSFSPSFEESLTFKLDIDKYNKVKICVFDDPYCWNGGTVDGDEYYM